MRSLCWTAILITLVVGSSAFGTWIPIQSFQSEATCQVAVQPTGNGVWQLDVSLPGVQINSYEKQGQAFQSVQLPGEAKYDDAEAVSLPSLSRFIGLTKAGNPNLEVVAEEWTDLPGTYVLESLQDAANPLTEQNASLDGFSPAENYHLSPRQMMGGVPLALFSANAVKYNSEQHKLKVLRRATLVIHENGFARDSRPITETTAHVLEPMLSNWDQLDYRNMVVRGTVLYVVAQDTLVQNGIQNLIRWRWKEGYKVETAGPGTITNWTTTGIKAYIADRFLHASPPLEFVCLVGDADASATYRIPCFAATYSGYSGASDLDYALLDGNDLLPDIAVGRFCFSTPADLLLQMNKTLRYETTPSPPSSVNFSKPNWYRGAGLFADPASGTGISPTMLMRTIREYLVNAGYPSSSIDTVYSSVNWTNSINASINSGVSVWCYRGWYNMNGYTVNSTNLTNSGQWPLIVNLTCGTNDYDGNGYHSCEDFMLAGTPQEPKGSIGIIGMSTTGTHTRYNNTLMAGAMQGFVEEGIHSSGGVLWRARIEVERNYSWYDSASGLTRFFEGITNLLGDPALDVFSDAPDTFVVSSPVSVPAGTNYLTLTIQNPHGVPVQGAYVNLLKGTIPNPQVFVGNWTDNAGHVALNFLASSAAETLYVTTTKHNFRPAFNAVAVIAGTNLVAPLSSSYIIDDDNLGTSHGNGDSRANPGETIEMPIPLKNWGTAVANGIQGVLSTNDPFIAAVTDNTEAYGTIAAGATGNSADDFDFVVGSYAPNGHVAHFTLSVTDNASHNWTSDIPITLANADLECDSMQLSSVGNGILDPGESGQITFYLKNAGLLASPAGLTGYLRSESPVIIVTDSVGLFPAAAFGSTTSNQTNTFGLRATSDAFPGQHIPLVIVFPLTAGFADTIYYVLTVGTVAGNAPTPPDTYGYWAFDDSDTAYAKHPVSATIGWVEADPRFGGTGNLIPLVDNDDQADASTVVDLPFAFRYYGQTYNQISVCSNGWLAMGAGEAVHTDFRNYRIPSATGPLAMIAPFWDDLRLSYTGAAAEAWHPVYKPEETHDGHHERQSLDVGSDYCTGIPVIPSLPYTNSGNTTGMTNDWTTSSCNIGNAPDVFYSYTPTVTTSVRVSLCGSSYDTGLMIRSGGACPGSAEVACNDDINSLCPSNGQNSQLDVTMNAGVTYFIIVDGYGSNFGAYTLNVTSLGIPPNQCANAAVIPSLPYTSSGSTAGHWSTYGFAAPDTFYKYTVPAGGDSLLITTCGSSFDTYLRVWRPCGSTQLAFDDNSCDGSTTSKVVGNFTAGDIWIQVEGNGTASGNYTLNVSHYTAPQQCQNAAVIASLPYVSAGNNCGQQNTFGWASPDTFYKYTVQAPGETLDINLCGSNFDTYLRVWRPCGGTELFTDDDYCTNQTSRIFQYFTAGDIWIQVEGWQTACGNYTLSIAHYTPPLPGGVFTKYDAANHQFIIEWSHAGKYGGSENLSEETFECILREPGHPVTPSGDGEILFQYKNIINTTDVTKSNDYCTVGIENPQKTDGVLYSFFNYTNPTIPGAAPLVSGRAVLFTTAQYSAGAPRAPEDLTLVPVGTDLRLRWNQVREDIHGVPISGVQYKIYAGTVSGFPIEPSALIATVSDTFYVDVSPGDAFKYYAVQATIAATALSTAPSDDPTAVSKATYQPKKGPIRQIRGDER